ncbi:MAG: long-chain fatty acid--CoA ligase [Bacteroidetes bacterium 4484_276]|nr:MAG: long-chain fatty acid--CoA ligase [Bacteroidetes bacterium 4484_276]OYT13552.1 MAG: long-chain fatty acid--CoA ligase [Bacteroidetes bacterium 4572_114]
MKHKNDQLNNLFAGSIKQNWALAAFSDYQGETLTYEDVGKKIYFLHKLFDETGIRKGDHIALLGNNSAMWGITFIGIISYGAVVVPVLNEFSSENIYHIVQHSECKLLFIVPNIYNKLEQDYLQGPKVIININDYSLIHEKKERFGKATEKAQKKLHEKNLQPEDVNYPQFDAESTCVISYTSGTSGFTKGVMLPRRSIYSNIIFAQAHMPLLQGNTIVSFLPMAHVFGMLFEFLFPFTMGCHTTFLTKIPSPAIVTKAFAEIKPHLILSVPLVIEKIYKKRILPSLEKPIMKFLLTLPIISGIIEKKVKEKLTETFGGRFREVVIGGAPLSEDVEQFFKKIGFRFTIGYGMTECGPLISYEGWEKAQYRSCGKIVDKMQIKVAPQQASEKIGEILVRGDNVMSGYFKNKEATEESFTEDGWLKTGDLGYLDKDGYIYLKGRTKNMILGPSGQNIYPEEVEAKVCNLPYVQECVVKYLDEKLIAMIYPDRELMKNEGLTFEVVEKRMGENIKTLNKTLPKYANIANIELTDVEFIKTPKKNIKRYLYT